MEKLYRYRIWKDLQSKNGYAFDSEIHVNEGAFVPDEILNLHKEKEVYSIYSNYSELGEDVPVVMMLCDDLDVMKSFIQGIKFSFNLENLFENNGVVQNE